jgi:tetratricopeptide (TPR) repeat protein
LAASDKAHGLWLLPAVFAGAAFFHRPIRKNVTREQALAAAAAYLAGALPLLIHNLTRQAETFVGPGVKRLAWEEHAGALGAALGDRLASLVVMISGTGAWTAGGTPAQATAAASLALAAAALPLAAWRLHRRELAPLRWAAAFWSAMAMVLLLATLAPYRVKSHHFYLVYSFPWLATLALCFGGPRPRRFVALLWAAAILLLGARAQAVFEFRRQVALHGGAPMYYAGIEELANWLGQRGGPVMAEDGIERRLALQTGGRLASRTIPWSSAQEYLGGKERVTDCFAHARSPRNTLLFLEGTKSLPAMLQACRIVGVELARLRDFTLRDGSPWVSAYEARELPLTARQKAMRRRLQEQGILLSRAPQGVRPSPPAPEPLPGLLSPLALAESRLKTGTPCSALAMIPPAPAAGELERVWGVLRAVAACPGALEAAAALSSRLGTAEARLRQAQVLAAGGKRAEASNIIKALPLKRLDPGARRDVALLHQNLGETSLACEILGRLAGEFPTAGSLQKDLGICLFLLGRKEESIVRLRAAVRLLPGDEAAAGSLKAVLEGR